MHRDDRTQLLPLFLAAMIFVVLAPVFWMHTELPAGRAIERAYDNIDLYQRVYPSFSYGFARLREGALPLWNPHQLCGTPFLANPATGLFQPLNAIFLAMAPERAMAAHAFLGLALAGACFLLCARALGAHTLPALIGGLAFVFSGAGAAAMSRPEVLGTLAWSPLLYWALIGLVRRPDAASAALAGVAAALVFLAGAPVLALVMAGFGVVLAAAVAWMEAPEGGRPAARLRFGAWAAVVAAGLTAVQWVPALAWARGLAHPRGVPGGLDIPGQMPKHAGELLAQMLSPAPDLSPRLAYFGVFTLVLLAPALLHRRARGLVVFFAMAAAVAFALALSGGALGLAAVPPQMLIFPAAFCVAMLAAFGADRLFEKHRDFRAPRRWLPWLVLALGAAGLFFAAGSLARGRIVAGVLVLLPFFFAHRRPVAVSCGLVLALLSFADLRAASVNVFQHPFHDAESLRRRHEPLLTAAAAQALNGRMLIASHPLHTGLPANLGMVHRLASAGGAGLPLGPDEVQWWRALRGPEAAGPHLEPAREAPGLALLNHMAVRVVLATGDSALSRGEWHASAPRLRPLQRVQDIDLLLNDDALPRAYWVPGWTAVEDVDAAIAALLDPAFDAGGTAVLTLDAAERERLAAVVPPAPAAALPNADSVACEVTDLNPEAVRVRLTTPGPGLLVLADRDAPGWRARVDGGRVPILRANGLFRAVALPAGEHVVDFSYRPRAVLLGLAITLLCGGALGLAGLRRLARPAQEDAG
jgi:hypothetical protein